MRKKGVRIMTEHRYTMAIKRSSEPGTEIVTGFDSVDDAIEYGRVAHLVYGDEITLTDSQPNPYMAEIAEKGYTMRFATDGFTVTINPAKTTETS
jgi:hypothetical protein